MSAIADLRSRGFLILELVDIIDSAPPISNDMQRDIKIKPSLNKGEWSSNHEGGIKENAKYHVKADAAFNPNPHAAELKKLKAELFAVRLKYGLSAVISVVIVIFIALNNKEWSLAIQQLVSRTVDFQSRQAEQIQVQQLQPNRASSNRRIILQSDRTGHFKGTLKINNTEVPFLVDTGATFVTIPQQFALNAGLALGNPIPVSTAAGVVLNNLTIIDSLRIGNAEIKHLTALINSNSPLLLFGANALKYFRVTQAENTMILEAYDNPEESLAFQSQNPNDFRFFDIQLDWMHPGSDWQRFQKDGNACFYRHLNGLETISCNHGQHRQSVVIELDINRPDTSWKQLQMDGKQCFYQNEKGIETISCKI